MTCNCPIQNTASRYGALAKLLHWSMAVIILCLFAAGLIMSDMENSPDRFTILFLHKSFGILILFLVAIRLGWRLVNVQPPMPDSMRPIEKAGAHLAHYALYGLMFCVPLLGWLLSSAAGITVNVFHLFNLPNLVEPDKIMRHTYEEWHETAAWTLVLLAGAHACAALWHHFVKKDTVLKRMLPCAKLEESS